MAGRFSVNHPLLVALRRYFALVKKASDPAGLMRVDAGGKTVSVWDYMPTQPGVPLDEIVPHVWTFKDPTDIVSDVIEATTYKWAETNSGSGTPLAVQDEHGGVGKILNAATDNSYYFYEGANEIVKPTSGKNIWFECEVKVGDVSEADMFIGLNARLASGNIFDNRANCIGFYMGDGSSSIYTVTTKAGEAEGTGHDALSDDTWVKLGFRYDGSVVYFFCGDTDT